MALYKFLLFDKTLNSLELKWVQDNIMDNIEYWLFDDGKDLLYDDGNRILINKK